MSRRCLRKKLGNTRILDDDQLSTNSCEGIVGNELSRPDTSAIHNSTGIDERLVEMFDPSTLGHATGPNESR